jgi:2-keto-3-deoxy-L-rhamnonate aldolase RhmA
MVRVPACLHHLIAPVLDAGAMGIMAPLVETREQAELLVNACRYRPLGRRGLAFGMAHDGYAAGPARAKMDAANESIVTIVLIESARGIENADAILATPGLDLAWLGHYDLSDSLACVEAFDDPRYVAAEQRLLAASKSAGIPLGWLVGTGEAARAAIARGYRCICIGHELMVFRNALAREFAEARNEKRGQAL